MVAIEPHYCHQCGAPVEWREHEDRKRAWCPSCEQLHFRNAVPAVSVAVHDTDRVLLIERAVPPDAGRWALPGGHPEYDEKPRPAAVRELAEETGVTVDPTALSLLDVTYGMPPNTDLHYYLITYGVQRARDDVSLAPGSDAADARFWPIDAVLERDRNIRPIDREPINKLARLDPAC